MGDEPLRGWRGLAPVLEIFLKLHIVLMIEGRKLTMHAFPRRNATDGNLYLSSRFRCRSARFAMTADLRSIADR